MQWLRVLFLISISSVNSYASSFWNQPYAIENAQIIRDHLNQGVAIAQASGIKTNVRRGLLKNWIITSLSSRNLGTDSRSLQIKEKLNALLKETNDAKTNDDFIEISLKIKSAFNVMEIL